MNKESLNILVARNLTFTDLAAFAQVSRATRAACSKEELWQNECIRVFVGDMELFAPINCSGIVQLTTGKYTGWRSLMRGMVMAKQAWNILEGDIFSQEDVLTLHEFIGQALIDPMIPPTILRREPKTYPTVVQDLIANELLPSDQPASNGFSFWLPEPAEDLVLRLDECGQVLFEEFQEQKELNHLALARWQCRDSRGKEKFLEDDLPSLGSSISLPFDLGNVSTLENSDALGGARLQSTYNLHTLKSSSSTVMKVYRSIKKQVVAHWKLVCQVINCSKDGLLKEYAKRWRGFSATIHAIYTTFKPFSVLLNDIYNAKNECAPQWPPFTIYRLLIVQWRRHVLAPIEEQLLDEVLSLFQSQRDSYLNNILENQEDSDFLIACIECIIDVSVHELSIQFLDHTQLYREGAYENFHNRFLRQTINFYQRLSAIWDPEMLTRVMKADERLAKQWVLPWTLHDIEKIKWEYLLTAWKKFFAEKFMAFIDQHILSHIDPAAVQFLSTTQFGLHLFKLAPSNETKPKIRNFIKALANEKADYITIIRLFNELQERVQSFECEIPPVEDELIEARAEKLGLTMELSDDDISLYSMCYDLTPDKLESLLADATLELPTF